MVSLHLMHTIDVLFASWGSPLELATRMKLESNMTMLPALSLGVVPNEHSFEEELLVQENLVSFLPRKWLKLEMMGSLVNSYQASLYRSHPLTWASTWFVVLAHVVVVDIETKGCDLVIVMRQELKEHDLVLEVFEELVHVLVGVGTVGPLIFLATQLLLTMAIAVPVSVSISLRQSYFVHYSLKLLLVPSEVAVDLGFAPVALGRT